MTGRMVSADEAREAGRRRGLGKSTRTLYVDLAHTVVQQAEQIAAVLALHANQDGHCGWCCEDTDGYDRPIFAEYPCPTARALGVTA